jgi:hypothetical protein
MSYCSLSDSQGLHNGDIGGGVWAVNAGVLMRGVDTDACRHSEPPSEQTARGRGVSILSVMH